MEEIRTYKIPGAFINEFKHWRKIELFRRVIYIFLLINAISLLPIAYDLWSYDGMIGARYWDMNTPTWKQGSFALLNVLSHPANAIYPWVYVVFVVGQIVFLITGIFRFLPRISSILVYFFTVNLFLKGYLVFTGGEVLVGFLLFYLIFIQRSKAEKFSWSLRIPKDEKPEFSFVQNVLNNTFYWILLIQVCVLYFFSTFYKLYDQEWISGTAVMYVSRIETFSTGVTHYLFADNYFLSAVASYSILLYGGLFPLVVWYKKWKVPFLFFGVLFHLGIAFGLGIFAFGILMCLVYLLFLDIEQIDKIRNFFRLKKSQPR